MSQLEDTARKLEVIDGNEILLEVRDFLNRFVAYPDDYCANAHTLWIAHTHLMDAWESTPRIAFLSTEPESGKTRALEVTQTLVPRPVEAVNVTPAYLFRKVGDEDGSPTVLFDEIDTVFGPKAKDNEEIRGLLNAGHRRGAVAGRCVTAGRVIKTEEIPAYCAVALAGLGFLPDTILSRSIVIQMRRRSPNEQVDAWRHRVHAPEGEAIKQRLEQWALGVADALQDAWPEMPDGIEDRSADVWEPLLAIADIAGGEWPELARVTAVTAVTDLREGAPSLGIRLLSDISEVFKNQTSMFTTDLLQQLNDDVEKPWGNLRGMPLDARGLSNRLRPYGVKPTSIRIEDQVAKGYKAEDLHDPWQRYLPASDKSVTSVTNVTKVDW